MNKKKIFAIVLFLIMVIFMFTFANPSHELKRLGPDNDEQEEKPVVDKVEEPKDDDSNKITVSTNNRFLDAKKAVAKAEESLSVEDLEKALSLVKKLSNGQTKKELTNRLNEVQKAIDVISLVNHLEEMTASVSNPDDVTSARNYRTDKDVVKLVNGLTNEKVKADLLSRLEALSPVLDDEEAPVISGVNHDAMTNQVVNLEVTDASNVTVTLNGSEVTLEDLKNICEDGEYTVVARDEAYNEDTLTFTIDATDPVIGFVDGTHTKDSITPDVVDANLDKATLSKNDGEPTSYPIVNDKGSELSGEGKYTITVTDLAGNTTTKTLIVDTTAPTISIDNYDLEVERSDSESFVAPTYSATDNYTENVIVEVTECSVNRAVSGTYHCTYVATDLASNKTEATLNVTIKDTLAPAVEGIDLDSYVYDGIGVTPTSSDLDIKAVTLMKDGLAVNDYTLGTAIVDAGTYTLTVTDNTGLSTVKEFEITKADVTIEWTKPELSYDGHEKEFIATVKRGDVVLNTAKVKYDDLLHNVSLGHAPVDAGKYLVSADYAGDSNHNAAHEELEVTIEMVIDSDEDLAYAIKNQYDGETWLIKEGTYHVYRGSEEYGLDSSKQTGWYLPIVANNVTVKGEGNVVLRAGEQAVNANHSSQNFVTIFGDNVTIDNVTLVAQTSPDTGMPNKVVEIFGDNATLSNVTVDKDTLDFAGSIYINQTGITTTLTNVTLNKGRITLSGANETNKLVLNDVTADFASAVDEASYYGFWNPNAAEVEANNFTVTASSAMALEMSTFVNQLPANTRVVLEDGTYSLGHLEITREITLEGTSHNTVLNVDSDPISGQAGVYVKAPATIKNLKIAADTSKLAKLNALKVSYDSNGIVDHATIDNVVITGGYHGINIHGVANATINNVQVSDTNALAISVASSNVTLTNSTLNAGGWGYAMGIMYNPSNPTSYPCGSNVNIGTGNTIVSGVYAEYYENGNDYTFEDSSLWTEAIQGTTKGYMPKSQA